jgi:predicted nucleic acid-binding Zn ribbon protein
MATMPTGTIPVPEPRTACIVCGHEMPPTARRTHVCCSPACRGERTRQKAAENWLAAGTGRPPAPRSRHNQACQAVTGPG